MRRYNSKIGVGLVFFLALVVAGPTSFMIFQKVWLGVVINLLVAGFIWHLFTSTYYVIDGKILNVRSGFLVNESIEIETIKKITETNTPISAPATSFDRLRIDYNEYGTIVISPRDKEAFIEQLRKINPKIKVS